MFGHFLNACSTDNFLVDVAHMGDKTRACWMCFRLLRTLLISVCVCVCVLSIWSDISVFESYISIFKFGH